MGGAENFTPASSLAHMLANHKYEIPLILFLAYLHIFSILHFAPTRRQVKLTLNCENIAVTEMSRDFLY